MWRFMLETAKKLHTKEVGFIHKGVTSNLQI